MVTSISLLCVKFIIKAMIGEKERLYILAQEKRADRTCAYASDFCTSVNYLGKLQAVLEILKIFIEVVWDEIKEG